ncbi:MAG: magnesium transporter [Candidatus Pacearchaeota archaeon]
MNNKERDFKEIFSSQFISLIGGIFAGTILAVYTNNLLLIPGMLILLPGFLEMRGGISGSLAARITSGMFLGFIKPNKIKTKIIKGNIIASFILVIIVSLFLGVLAYFFTLIIFDTSFPKIIIYSLLAALIANIIEIPLTLFFTFYLFKKGYDPDNIMGPFVTTTGDITSIISLLVVIMTI